jgi:hypothetical protein
VIATDLLAGLGRIGRRIAPEGGQQGAAGQGQGLVAIQARQ